MMASCNMALCSTASITRTRRAKTDSPATFGDPSWSMAYCTFPRPDQIPAEHKKEIRAMMPKAFGMEQNLQYVETEAEQYAAIIGGMD